MFFIDWGLGALQANAIISYWWFLSFNIPFGVPFVLIETHWTGTNYQLIGLNIDEIGSTVAWLFAVLGQALIYLLLFDLLRRKKHITSAA
jgi:hypothetical protein